MNQNDLRRYLIGAVGGAGIATLALWPSAPPPAPPPPTGVDRSATEVVRQQGPAVEPAAAVDPNGFGKRLDDIAVLLHSLEQRIDRALAGAERTPVATAPTTVAIDADSLERAQQEIERRRFEAMSDDELRQTAWRSYKANADGAAAVQALELLAQRATDPAKRDAALTELATMQRLRGGEDSLAASAQNLRTVLAANGIGSERGVAAAAQLVYTLAAQGDRSAALQQAEAVIGSAAATPWTRAELRMSAADVRQQMGDGARARADYEALLRDIDGNPDFVKLAKEVRARLDK